MSSSEHLWALQFTCPINGIFETNLGQWVAKFSGLKPDFAEFEQHLTENLLQV